MVQHNYKRTVQWQYTISQPRLSYRPFVFCRTNNNPYLPHYKSPTALSHMHHLTCGISSLLHSVNLILFTVILVRSPHPAHITSSQSPPSLPSLLLPLHFTPDLKLISFTNPFLHSQSYSFRTDFTYLNLYWIKGALFCFSFWLRVLD